MAHVSEEVLCENMKCRKPIPESAIIHDDMFYKSYGWCNDECYMDAVNEAMKGEFVDEFGEKIYE